MKKILCFMIIMFFAMSSAAFCDPWEITSSKADKDVGDFRASKNVVIKVNSTATEYAAVADHLNGEKAFGVAYNSSLVYQNDQDKSKGSHWSGTLSATDSGAFTAGNWVSK